MEAFVTIMFCWLLFVIIRMSFRNIVGRRPQFPPTDAEDVRVEMVDDEPEYELPEGAE